MCELCYLHRTSHTTKSITSNILSKSTINRINFHRDLWMLCDVTFFVGRKICERKKTELKIDSSNRVTGANNQHTTKDCRMFYTRKVHPDEHYCQRREYFPTHSSATYCCSHFKWIESLHKRVCLNGRTLHKKCGRPTRRNHRCFKPSNALKNSFCSSDPLNIK